MFNVYSWGLPGLVTLVTVILHLTLPHDNKFRPGVGDNECFLGSYLAKLVYLHGIIAVILVINLVFFLASAYNLLFGVWSPGRDQDKGTFQVKRFIWL